MSGSLSTGIFGAKSGTVTINYQTAGAVNGVNNTLGTANIGSQTITLNGNVYQVAQPTFGSTTISLGNVRVGGTAQQALSVTNTNVAPGFQEGLTALMSGATAGITAGGSFANLAAGSTNNSSLLVGLNTGTSGAKGGTANVVLTSTGTGTSGLGNLSLGTQTIDVSGNVYQLAAGQINTAALSFGTVQVGQAVTRTLSIGNVATGASGFVEDLNASFGATSGTGAGLISGTGSISGLVAGGTNASNMVVSVDTSAAATVNGAIAVNFVSAGAVNSVSNGLGTFDLGSVNYGVVGLIQANVINTAAPVISNSPIALGNVRVGAASPTALVSVTNQAGTPPQAALNATISGNAPITASGSFNLLAPGGTDNSSLQVGMNTGTAGAVNGTATIAFVSDASNVGGCAPNCQLNLPSQNVTVTGGVFQVAQPNVPAGVNLGNFRLGSAPTQAVTIGNTNISPAGYQEGLDASVSGTSGQAVASGGPISNLAQGGTSSAISVGLNNATATAGANSGTVTLTLASNGAGTSGLSTLALAPATINISGTGFNTAAGSTTPSPVLLANQRVGGALSQQLTVANTAPAGSFSEDLNAGFGSNTGAATNNGGSISGRLAGTNNTGVGTMSVGVDTTSSGAKTGTVTVNYQTAGAVGGVSNGLGASAAGTQTIDVSGNVYQLAAGQINTAALSFGTVQVGQAVTRTLSIGNVATGASGFVEDLNASFGATSGTGAGLISGTGSISGLVAGGTNASNMVVSVDTSAAATVNGAIAVNFVSAGAVNSVSNGLGTFDLGSVNYGVVGLIQANVINTAAPVISNSPIALGNVRVGAASPTALVSVTNQAGTPPQAALNATISGNAPITASGSFNLLAPGGTDNSSLQVGMNTGTAGAVNGTATIAFVSDASNVGGCAPNCQLNLPSQNVTVTGGVFQVAQPNVPAGVNLGNFRLGSAPTQAVTIGNTNISPAGYQEGLDASVSGTSGQAVASGGPISNLAQGGTSSAISVGLNNATATAGANSGTVTLTLASNGAGTSGLSTLALAPATINISGTGYRVANPTLNTPAVTIAARVGDATAANRAVSITNTSADAFTEGLKVSIGSVSGNAQSNGGAITNLAAGATNGSAILVGLASTATAGLTSGTVNLSLISTGAGTTGAPDLALAAQTVNVNGKIYTPASAQLNTAAVNFGIVRVGDIVATRDVSVKNTAAASALNDTLSASVGAVSGPFTGGGSESGLGAGASNGSGSLIVGLNTAAAGVFNGTADVGFLSQNPDMTDLDLGIQQVLLVAQVNNLANPMFGKTSGAGNFGCVGFVCTLDLGNIVQGSGLFSTSLFLQNDAVAPADSLKGLFDLSAVDDFANSGWFDPLGLDAGESLLGLGLGFDPQTLGLFTDTLFFDGLSFNADDLAGRSLARLTLQLRANVIQQGGSVPEPGTLAMILLALMTAMVAKRRRMH